MANYIEVVKDTYDDVKRLATATWNNDVPGFQIDGVCNVDELFEVFGIIREASPSDFPEDTDYYHVYPIDGDFDKMSSIISDKTGLAHVDSHVFGMAVHHNITGVIPVKLALCRFKSPEAAVVDFQYTEKLIEGETVPGRLTIFSEGRHDLAIRSAHQFARTTNTGNEWARYIISGSESICNDVSTRNIAQLVFDRLALEVEVS
jgi:hypothetical protein